MIIKLCSDYIDRRSDEPRGRLESRNAVTSPSRRKTRHGSSLGKPLSELAGLPPDKICHTFPKISGSTPCPHKGTTRDEATTSPGESMSINSETLTATLVPFITQAERQLHDQGLIPGLEHARDSIVAAIDAYSVAKEVILSDMDLSTQGRASKIQDIKRIATDRIDHVKDLSTRLSEIEARIFAPLEKKTDVQQLRDELRQAEIRKHYWLQDETQLTPIILTAIEEGNSEIVNALLGSPVPMFSGETLKKHRKEHALKRLGRDNPAIMLEYEDLELINGLISGMKSTAYDYLK